MAAAVLWLVLPAGAARAQSDPNDLAVIRSDRQTGFANGGWAYDRYQDLKKLDAHQEIVVADIKGPAVIRHIHMCRHNPKELCARGIVLEIWFDDAKQPAVACPVADFFGDGCNGGAMDFSSKLIECAPWSYNCYFPMPFASRARVILRNDTDKNVMDYSYVEWETLPQWDANLGYFHATYGRKCFQLTKESDEVLFDVQGTGHLVGRQFSVVTDEPHFRAYNVVMEGNNEVDVDGRPRALDYLGTEDSFTFSWGFQRTFAGLRAGITLVEHGSLNRLSIYRFHDHMPIRFNKSLRWHINWSQEKFFTGDPKWAAAVARGGCWVDYATVYYWYQTVPGGYQHAPLAPVAARQKTLLRSSQQPLDLGSVFEKMPVDPQMENTFASQQDMDRVKITGCYVGTHPFWIDRPQPKGGHPGNPNPGKQGILALHAAGPETPCLVMRKVALPAGKASLLRIVVSGDPYEMPGQSDFLLQAGVQVGKETKWFKEEVIDAGTPPSEENWKTLQYDLAPYAGKDVGIVVKISYGGRNAVMNEEAFVDEVSVVTP